eukprot:381557-Alexandrium_andersonii.AAC.1
MATPQNKLSRPRQATSSAVELACLIPQRKVLPVLSEGPPCRSRRDPEPAGGSGESRGPRPRKRELLLLSSFRRTE